MLMSSCHGIGLWTLRKGGKRGFPIALSTSLTWYKPTQQHWETAAWRKSSLYVLYCCLVYISLCPTVRWTWLVTCNSCLPHVFICNFYCYNLRQIIVLVASGRVSAALQINKLLEHLFCLHTIFQARVEPIILQGFKKLYLFFLSFKFGRNRCTIFSLHWIGYFDVNSNRFSSGLVLARCKWIIYKKIIKWEEYKKL